MGRKLRRKMERSERLASNKTKVSISRSDFADEKQRYAERYNKGTIEQMYVCMALAERRLYKFGQGRLLKTMHTVDELMGEIYNGNKTIDDYITELKEQTGMEIGFDK